MIQLTQGADTVCLANYIGYVTEGGKTQTHRTPTSSANEKYCKLKFDTHDFFANVIVQTR